VLRRIFFVFILLNPFSICHGQLKFEQLQSKVGFDVINSIHRDSRGYLWIGNHRQGLMRHNSYETEVFGHSEIDSTTMSDNGVNRIYEGSEGTIWIGTRHGLNRYIRQANNFKRYYHYPSDSNSLQSNTVNNIYEDDKNNLWIITSKGVNLYIPGTDGFKSFNRSNELLSHYELSAMAMDHNGQYWIATLDPGLWLFDPKKDTVIYYGHAPAQPNRKKERHLFVDDDNKIWVSSKGNGIYIFDPQSKTYSEVPINDNGSGLNGNLTADIQKWDDQFLLISVDQGGVNIYDKKNKSFSYINGANNLSSDGVYCIDVDHEGIIWVGTSRGGVNFYNPNKYQFKTYAKDMQQQSNSLSYSIVSCFFEEENGNIWIGTDGGGINILNVKTDEVARFDDIINTPKHNYNIKTIRSISKDKNGSFWIATWNEGIWRYNPTTKSIENLTLKNAPNELANTPIWKLYIDKKNRFWITLMDGDIYLLDSDMSILSHFFQNKIKHTIDAPLVHEFFGKIYATTNHGIYVFDEDMAIFKQLAQIENVLDLKMDKTNMYAITSNNGLFVLNHNGKTLKHIYKPENIPTKYLLSIVQANNGKLWASSINGILELDIERNSYRSFNKRDGLQDNQFFIQSSLKTSNGNLLFGGIKGLTLLNPDSIIINSTPTPVHIEGIKLFNKPIDLSNERPDSHYINSELPELKLNWNDKMLTIDFVGINFTSPLKNEYMYKLEGFDTDWIKTSANNRNATYTNLPPGEYLFTVKASNNSGVWNNKGASLKISVKSPFWKEPWFIFCLIASIIAITFIYIERIELKLRKDKELLQQKVNERTKVIQEQHNLLNERNKEIQSQNEELRVQNEVLFEQRDIINALNKKLEMKVEQKTTELTISIKELNKTIGELDRFIYSTSHELSAPMKSVLGLVNIAKSDMNGNIGEYFDYIEKSILKQEEVIKALISFSRNSRSEVKIEPIELNQAILDSIEELKYMDNFNTIDFHLDIDNGLVIYTDFIRFKIIINNLLSNAIKYTDPKKEKRWVKIKCQQQSQFFTLSVSDNGIGIEREYLHQVFDMFFRATEHSTGTGLGLYIVLESMKRLNGHINVASEKKVGSEFNLVFPFLDQPA